jgi:membrane protein
MPSNRPNNFHAKQVQSETRAQQQGRGRDAERPRQIPAKGWKDILWRLVTEIKR